MMDGYHDDTLMFHHNLYQDSKENALAKWINSDTHWVTPSYSMIELIGEALLLIEFIFIRAVYLRGREGLHIYTCEPPWNILAILQQAFLIQNIDVTDVQPL